MNITRILACLKADGFIAKSKWANDNSGVEVGVRIKGYADKWIVGLAPIDDESDMRFVEALESMARKSPEQLRAEYVEER
jgi:hypothetical protein